jgi:hypothetical protein
MDAREVARRTLAAAWEKLAVEHAAFEGRLRLTAARIDADPEARPTNYAEWFAWLFFAQDRDRLQRQLEQSKEDPELLRAVALVEALRRRLEAAARAR